MWRNSSSLSLSLSFFSSLSLPLQELDDIRKSGQKVFRNIAVDESNILKWQGLIVPVSRTLRNKPHPLQLVTGGVASLTSCDLIVHLYLFVTSSWVLRNIRRYFLYMYMYRNGWGLMLLSLSPLPSIILLIIKVLLE